jgi:hypothetical protein
MTDCDHKERKALIEVWPDIHLILCLFHVSQSWENKLKVVLGHHGGHEIVAFRKEIYQFLRNFTENLKNVNDSFYINQITHIITNTEIRLKVNIVNKFVILKKLQYCIKNLFANL